MKTYKNLWPQLIDRKTILTGTYNAANGNMKRKALEEMKANPEKYVDTIRAVIEAFKAPKHTTKLVIDGMQGKVRKIVVPNTFEHVIHHCVVEILKPIMMRGMYDHSYASIPGRGCHKGAKTIKKWIRNDPKNIRYYLKIDIKNFFGSIPHDKLVERLERNIKDRRFMAILKEIIETTPEGLPLGFYTSQWLANFYLQDFDHYVKEVLKIPHYIRYMDDMVFFSGNRRRLKQQKEEIRKAFAILGLEMKKNWRLCRFDGRCGKGHPLDFMGFRFYRSKTTMRKRIMLKASRKAARIAKKAEPTVYDARQMLSYLGWIKATDCHEWAKKWIYEKISIRNLKKIVSRTERRQDEKRTGTAPNRLRADNPKRRRPAGEDLRAAYRLRTVHRHRRMVRGDHRRRCA